MTEREADRLSVSLAGDGLELGALQRTDPEGILEGSQDADVAGGPEVRQDLRKAKVRLPQVAVGAVQVLPNIAVGVPGVDRHCGGALEPLSLRTRHRHR